MPGAIIVATCGSTVVPGAVASAAGGIAVVPGAVASAAGGIALVPGAVVAAGGLAEEPGAVAAAARGAALRYRPPCQAPFTSTVEPLAAMPGAIVDASGGLTAMSGAKLVAAEDIALVPGAMDESPAKASCNSATTWDTTTVSSCSASYRPAAASQ